MNTPLRVVTALILGVAASLPLAADNLSREGFVTSTLSNGIPVYLKSNPNNQVLALQLSLRGGSALRSADTAGWEDLALSVLSRGSQRYSYDQLQDLEWRSSATLGGGASGFDAAGFTMVGLPSSFDTLFDAWSDALVHPRWDPEEFDAVLQQAKISLQRRQQDPYGRAVTELHKVSLAGHPYAADFNPTAASLKDLTLDKLKAWWEEHFVTGRLAVVAVGNFDPAVLQTKLQATLGTLPARPFSAAPVPRWSAAGQVVIVPFADAGDVGYVRADFAAPPASDPDSDALRLGFSVLDDILFDVVRTKYGASYGAYCQFSGFLAPYGALVVQKTDQPGKIKAYLDEAIDLLASGKALASQASVSAAGKSGLGAAAEPRQAAYVPLEQVLAFYKAKAINGFYESQQTNGAIAAQMAGALLYRGDVKAYLDYAERVNRVTAADLIRVITTYVKNSPKAWVVLAAPALLEGVTAAQFGPGSR